MKEDRKKKDSAGSVAKKRMTEGKLKIALKKKYAGMASGTPLEPRTDLHRSLGGADRTIKRAVEALTVEGFFIPDAKNRLVVSGMGVLTDHNPSTIESFLEFRMLIEPVVAEVAARAFKSNPKEADTPQKVAFLHAWGELRDPKYDAGVQLDKQADRNFHRAIHALSTNPMLGFVLKRIDHFFEDNIDSVVSRLYAVGSYRDDTYKQHQKMAEAIFAGKEEQARTATREHLSYAHQAILRYIRDTGR